MKKKVYEIDWDQNTWHEKALAYFVQTSLMKKNKSFMRLNREKKPSKKKKILA